MALGVVQVNANASSGASTQPTSNFGATPTNGNLLLAVGFIRNQFNPSGTNGWNVASFSSLTNWNAVVYYKYASSTPSSEAVDSHSTFQEWGLTFYEISGVQGTFWRDCVALHFGNQNGSNATQAAGSITTNAATTLVLSAFAGQFSANTSTVSWSGNTGWTLDSQKTASSGDAFGVFNWASGGHRTNSGSNTISSTQTTSANSLAWTSLYVELGSVAGPVVDFTSVTQQSTTGTVGAGGSLTASHTLTNSDTNEVVIVDIIVATANNVGAPTMTVTGTGLTFAARLTPQLITGTLEYVMRYWAKASAQQAANNISVQASWSGTPGASAVCFNMYSVAGLGNPTSPWDPNGTLPAFAVSSTKNFTSSNPGLGLTMATNTVSSTGPLTTIDSTATNPITFCGNTGGAGTTGSAASTAAPLNSGSHTSTISNIGTFLYSDVLDSGGTESVSATIAITDMAFNIRVADSATKGTIAIVNPAFNTAGVVEDFVTASIAIGFMTFLASHTGSRVTQFSNLVLATASPHAAITQGSLQVLSTNSVKGRVTQMVQLVLAKGGEGPLVPDLLNLHDMGREPVLRQRLVNMYPEPTPQGPAQDARYQRGGLYNAAMRGGGPIQLIQHWIGPDPTTSLVNPATDQFVISISGGNVFRDNVNIGVVDPNIDPKWFPRGRRIRGARSQTQFMATSNGKLYSIQLDSVAQVPTVDVLPSGIRDVGFLAGRFVYVLDDDSGQFYWSDIGDGTSIDGLSFATASEDDPLPLLSIWDLSDDLCMFTTETVEFWYASADPDNPYQRSTGRRYNKGLLAIDSVELLDNSLFWLGHDRKIYRTSFIYPQKVSSFDIDDRIRRLTDEEVQQCYSMGVTKGGHDFYVIHLMSQGTWALDIASKTWAEWKSYNKDRFRAFCTDDTYTIFGDYFTGMLMGMDGGIYNDVDDDGVSTVPIERICSGYWPLEKGRLNNFNAILHCTRGVGTPLPGFGHFGEVEMRFADHENNDFSPWLVSYLGAPGEYGEGSKAVWSMLGGMSPPGRLFEFRCTADIFFAPFKLRVNEERP